MTKICHKIKHLYFREFEETIERQTQTITQMKTYLSESENTTKSTEIWKKDFENVKQKLEVSLVHISQKLGQLSFFY